MPFRPSSARTRAVLLAAALGVVTPRGTRAENAVAYKYSDYRESGGRVAVETQTALVEQDLGPDYHARLTGTLDAITGATPTGEPAPAGSDQVRLSQLHDRRKAWNADLSRQFARVNLAIGFGNSRESDYVSNGWSLNALTDFNGKNTTLLTGVAGTDDDVKVFFQTPRVKKRSNDVIVGVTQLLDPRTAVTFNLTSSARRLAKTAPPSATNGSATPRSTAPSPTSTAPPKPATVITATPSAPSRTPSRPRGSRNSARNSSSAPASVSTSRAPPIFTTTASTTPRSSPRAAAPPTVRFTPPISASPPSAVTTPA